MPPSRSIMRNDVLMKVWPAVTDLVRKRFDPISQ
jgi:hypothetical protein